MTETKKNTHRPKPPVIATEPVVVACGHTMQFEHFPSKQDAFRDARRAKFIGRACGPCRIEAGKKKAEELRAAAAAKKKPKPVKVMPDNRLPDGSQFVFTYSAKEKKWTGTLTIGDTIFQGEKSAVFKLFSHLDNCYREAKRLLEKTAS